MLFDNAIDDSQTQSRAIILCRPEWFKQMFVAFCSNTAAAVADRKYCNLSGAKITASIRFNMSSNLNPAALWSCLGRIIHQVDQHLPQLILVGIDGHVRRNLIDYGNAFKSPVRSSQQTNILDEIKQRETFLTWRNRPGIGEKFGDQ